MNLENAFDTTDFTDVTDIQSVPNYLGFTYWVNEP